MTRDRLLVDSSVWINYWAGTRDWHTTFLEGAFSTYEICLCDLNLTEVLQGIRDDGHFQKMRELLLSYTILPTLGKRMALRSAENFRFLRKQGITIRSTIDCIVATTAIEDEIPLLANDRDFLPFARRLGLQLLTMPT